MVKIKLDDELLPFVNLLEEDSKNTINYAYVDLGRLFISGCNNDDTNELMIRLNTNTKELIVARIHFIHQRQGYGKKLLDLLKQYGKENDYHYIVFESVLTDSMTNFLHKHNFKIKNNQIFDLNWIKEIDAI